MRGKRKLLGMIYISWHNMSVFGAPKEGRVWLWPAINQLPLTGFENLSGVPGRVKSYNLPAPG